MKHFIRGLILTTLLLPSLTVSAAEYSVRPFLFDLELEPRDIETKVVTLTNESPHHKYVVFATVNEISLDQEGKIKEFVSPVMTDRSKTVTSWIEVKRSRIEVPPNGTIEVPVTFRINPDAEPGEYQAFVGFVPAANRPLAERAAMNGTADGVVVKVSILDQRKDSMKLDSFMIDRFVLEEEDKMVSIKVKNLGDIASAPTGEVIFYDSKGAEVGASLINTEGTIIIEPGQTGDLSVAVPLEDTIGRFKANVQLDYGVNQKASLQDTTFFYLIPKQYIVALGAVVIILSIVITVLFRRVFLRQEYYGEDAEDVALYFKEGHDPKPKEHDIDLKNK